MNHQLPIPDRRIPSLPRSGSPARPRRRSALAFPDTPAGGRDDSPPDLSKAQAGAVNRSGVREGVAKKEHMRTGVRPESCAFAVTA